MTEPQTYDEAVQQVHRAFCDPDHELVGEWDREMAEALQRNGYAIIETGAGRVVQDGLDPERLRQCPSIMVLLNRYGGFNDAWWDRLVDEYARAAVAEPE